MESPPMTTTAATVPVVKSRAMVLVAMLALVSLPVLLVARDAVSFAESTRNPGSFVSSGRKREYVLYVPPSYDRTKPTPLVISMHGAGGWAVQQRDLSGWNRVADAQGFIVVYPSGVDGVGARIWHVDRGPGLERDVRFISALIDTIEASYNIDPARIYANGLSNGGGMSFVLSCTMSDRIAAVGLVAAARTLPFSWCTDRKPVPMIAFHGTDDPEVPYDGGKTWIAPDAFPNVPLWTKRWARRNRCAASPIDSTVAAGVTRAEYPHCADDAAVVLYTIKGGGHTWPGGEPMPEWAVGRTSNGVDATREMWAFFQAHPLRAAAP
jgi:polyhydroxybutyrate depolymerase